MDIETLKRDFRAVYREEPQVFRAPGRVNLIGEHTDYNEGFVMPAAIDFYTAAAIAPRSDTKVNVRSQSFDRAVSFDIADDLRPKHNWSDYVVGVIDQIRRSGERPRGMDILIQGEVPIGAGLSSSAAIEVAVGFALLNAEHATIDRVQLALLCQRAENEFVGMRCGIMDQFISCNGQRDHALMLDCRNLQFKLLPISPGVSLVICNTMVKHEHTGGEYNQRRADCEEGVRILQKSGPGIRSLRDVSVEQLERHREMLPPVIYRRCRHVVTENARVESAAEALQKNDLRAFGKLMAESHRSLRDDYEVSCRELDVMVEIATAQAGAFGARMTGGGFGGCTINLVVSEHAEAFRKRVTAEYEKAVGLTPDVYITSAADGAARVA